MEIIKGVIEAVSAKEKEVDQYGNTFRHSIKVGEEWIGLGGGKKASMNIKNGSEWYELRKGDEIEAIVERKGEWVNGKKSMIKLIAAGGGTAPSAAPARSNGGGNNGNKGVKVGHALTNACTLVAAGKRDDIYAAAVEILNLSERLNAEYDSVVGKVEATKPASQPSPTPGDDEPPF